VKTFTAQALTSPMIRRVMTDWTAIATFAQRASGITPLGLKAVALVKPEVRVVDETRGAATIEPASISDLASLVTALPTEDQRRKEQPFEQRQEPRRAKPEIVGKHEREGHDGRHGARARPAMFTDDGASPAAMTDLLSLPPQCAAEMMASRLVGLVGLAARDRGLVACRFRLAPSSDS
jgi:hypothetical protein